MKKLLTVFLCSFFLFGTVAVCGAVGFTLNYTVNAFEETNNDGLDIATVDILPNPFDFNLDVEGSITRNLFGISTTESAVNNDDLDHEQITIAMNFTAPAPAFGGDIYGETYGWRSSFTGFFQEGRLRWNTSYTDFAFGSVGDGILRVALSEEEFNEGILWGLGRCGATVQATFTYVTEASAAPVPEPSTILLMGVGLLGLVAVGRRKFNRKE